MERMQAWLSGICIVVLFASTYLEQNGFMPSMAWPFIALALLALYAVCVDRFWSKIWKDDKYDEKGFRKLVEMILRHRKDEKTIRAIYSRILGDDMNVLLRSNYKWATETLIKKSGGDFRLFSVIRDFCELTREHAVDEFKSSIRNHDTDGKKFNPEAISIAITECLRSVGGYPTWTDLIDPLWEVFEKLSRDEAESLMLKIEEEDANTEDEISRYQKVTRARSRIFQTLRVKILQRDSVAV